MDVVFISSGVNDICRYEKSSEILSDSICKNLDNFSKTYRDTVFIFNSILSTDYRWLSDDEHAVNHRVFELSLQLSNVLFLDTHEIFDNVHFDVLDRKSGIHLTHYAKHFITPIIRTCILSIIQPHLHPTPDWPLRAPFRRMYNITH